MIAIETRSGAEIEHGGRVLIPLARSIRLRLPGVAAGLVWNRPLGVLVKEERERELLRVPDRTRQLQWLLLGTSLAAALLRRRRFRRRRRASRRKASRR